MKIAFVIRKLAGRSGGAERVLVEAANEMAARGHRVWILHHENRGVGPFYEASKAVTVKNLFDRPLKRKDKRKWAIREAFRERLPHVFPLSHLKWEMTHRDFIRALAKFIEEEQPDVLIPFMPPAITPSVIAARGTQTRVIASTHNEPSHDYQSKVRWDQNPIDVRLRTSVLQDVDGILVLLPEYQSWYSPSLREKIEVMPNPIKSVDSARINTARREKLVVAVGRLSKVKRFDLLVATWAELRDNFPDWRVEIYGEGPDRVALEKQIKGLGLEGVVFLKGLTKSIADAYLRASVMCHPSAHEGFPLAVCEALAHGVPVVGFESCSGLNSLVVHGANGLLATESARKKSSLSETLKLVLSDEELRNNLAREAPGSVAMYEPSVVYDRWEGIVVKLSGRAEERY